MTSSFRIVPWSEDFIPALGDLIRSLTGGLPGRAVVVFPHSRPRRYLTDFYRQGKDLPLLLPRMMTGRELGERCLAAWDARIPPPRPAALLDQVALLKRGVDRLARAFPPDNPLFSLADEGGMERFFPWGIRLAGLLEECLAQMVDARDILYAEGEVEPFAAALLAELRGIRQEYLDALRASNLTTPGLDSHRAALYALENPPLPAFLENRAVILAGFVGLTRSEDALFQYLWRQGATICLHTDPAVASGQGHWSCAEHRAWLRRWRAAGEELLPPSGTTPRLHFFAGYDLHSQLQEMRKLLRGDSARSASVPDETPGSRAVILPHASLLMPVLHHLPDKDVNISMGYPLGRSLLARLTDAIFRARESRRPDGRLHWRPVLDLIRHPYVRMLNLPREQDDPSGDGVSLRPLLRRLEQRIREGSRLIRVQETLSDMLDQLLGDPENLSPGGGISEEAGRLLEQVLDTMLTAWAELSTLRQVAARLSEVCGLLLRCGGSIWPRFPLDAECLFRLTRDVIPELADNAMADDVLPVETLFAVARHGMAEARVPFEADPVTGLQVLGMLETRLLRFDRIFLLDATEDRLPGAPLRDPLLPDSLRSLLGLPDTRQRDVLAAHTLRRLMAGARDVHMFWQEGVESGGIFDSKKIRSRFVEEALWLQEKKRKKRLRPGEEPLRFAAFHMGPSVDRVPGAVIKSPAIRKRMEDLLARPLSPTFLDAYLSCPARFFRERMCGISPLPEVQEGDDAAGVGDLLHKVLRRAYEPFLGKVRRGDVSENGLISLFRQAIQAGDFRERQPAESWFMLEAAGPLRLRDYLRNQPEDSTLLFLEKKCAAVLAVENRARTLQGTLDRVDRRETGDVILDYKSGRLPENSASLWKTDSLWERLDGWTADQPDPLPELGFLLGSIQLPCYLFLYARETGNPAFDAIWVNLREDGAEMPLLGKNMDDETREVILEERIPSLLRFVLAHMQNAPSLIPLPGPRCQWCPFAPSCRIQGICKGKTP